MKHEILIFISSTEIIARVVNKVLIFLSLIDITVTFVENEMLIFLSSTNITKQIWRLIFLSSTEITRQMGIKMFIFVSSTEILATNVENKMLISIIITQKGLQFYSYKKSFITSEFNSM